MITEKLSKNEKRIIGLLQGHGTITLDYLKKKISPGNKHALNGAITHLLELKIIKRIGISSFQLVKMHPDD